MCVKLVSVNGVYWNTGKYYLIDSRYASFLGFLSPVHGERYHLSDFKQTRRPRDAQEKFNQVHSSLRTVIERCFGVLETRFPILKQMPSFSINTQCQIVITSCTIHNFIRSEIMNNNHSDDLFDTIGDENVEVDDDSDEDNNDGGGNGQNDELEDMTVVRRNIANQLALDYGYQQI
uniref:DDE Tnp4 domain-containing protein n=1 Tax=Nelumbo nucifera TaxID=4432 RepID=A0A822ZM79_NELNU|nr:TPA_asm: hypothetical protein HUJ06_002861 [Nelumbo nucifera]